MNKVMDDTLSCFAVFVIRHRIALLLFSTIKCMTLLQIKEL